MQTQILSLETLRPSVGQLAKTPFPTLKPLSDKEKSVGRHEKQNSHTSVHTHETKTVNGFRKGLSTKFFIDLVDLLYPNEKTVFHNADYVASISEVYRKEDRELFFRLVRAFALLRKSCRVQPITGVFETNDEDFWAAFRIMKMRTISKKRNPEKVGKKRANEVLSYLQTHFADKPFSSPEIAKKLKLNRHYATAILTHLHKQNRIELVHKKNQSGMRIFNLKQQEQ